MSNEGPQQGDPVGPLLFSNTIQPLLESPESDLPLGNLDDFTLGGPQSVVAEDVNRVVEIGQALGLDLNIGKCELVAPPETTVDDPRLCSFIRMVLTYASLLGAPLFHWRSIGQVLDRKLQ